MSSKAVIGEDRAVGNRRPAWGDMTLYLGAVGIVIAFSLVCLFFGRNFLTLRNIQNIVTQSSIIAVIAIGSSLVILTGGIDLSVGSVVGLVGMFAGALLKSGVPLWAACISALGVGALTGLVNGYLVSVGKVPSFIVTLGIMQIARGLALLTTLGKPISRFPDGLGLIMNAKVAGDMPTSVLYVFSLYFLMMFVMSLTRFGRHVYAFGGNPNAARLSGVRVRRVEMAVYVLSGLFAAAGGIMLLSRLSYADPNAGGGYEMHAIAAAVIGGISLSGGRGRIGNTLVGALILGSLTCGLQILNVPTYCQTIVTGVVIIAAVYADKAGERRAE
ncbi:MAG: ABC transporter permease [Planctomycetota bacterium]|jgi:ribose transport system permease protein|nr:ABC transporter permease [Planctomycetota bacterium]